MVGFFYLGKNVCSNYSWLIKAGRLPDYCNTPWLGKYSKECQLIVGGIPTFWIGHWLTFHSILDLIRHISYSYIGCNTENGPIHQPPDTDGLANEILRAAGPLHPRFSCTPMLWYTMVFSPFKFQKNQSWRGVILLAKSNSNVCFVL